MCIRDRHAEAKDEWRKWETDFPEKGRQKHGLLGRFFHHEGKTEKQAKQEDPTPEPTHEEHKHHFLHRLFHRAD